MFNPHWGHNKAATKNITLCVTIIHTLQRLQNQIGKYTPGTCYRDDAIVTHT